MLVLVFTSVIAVVIVLTPVATPLKRKSSFFSHGVKAWFLTVQGWNRSQNGCRVSDPDHRGGGREGRGGAAVVVQVDHGVVAGPHAAKGSACAHLSVSQALQVTLSGRAGREKEKEGVRLAETISSAEIVVSVRAARAFQGDTDRCQ